MIEIGVDIGGTFTDVAALIDGHRLISKKVRSTPHVPIQAVETGVKQILAEANEDASAVRRFLHGTTIATNAVLERKGARVALFTTEGFEDVLEIGRMKRSSTYDIFLDPETPSFIAPRVRRFGISERIGSLGTVIKTLDEDGVRSSVYEAIRQGVTGIGVCYLFSYVDGSHEERTRSIIRELAPEMEVTLSSEVHPVMREYERSVVTIFDAYVRPVMERYLSSLEQRLSAQGIGGTVHLMGSAGGLIAVATARHRPVVTLLSGPAAGVIGGTFEGRRAGMQNLITLDMGGTSCDVAVAPSGQVVTTTEGTIDTFPLTIPMVDVNSIGSGGGSIARVDQAGGLRVGPESAGADPGPASYGRGGLEPTVTDAGVVLGYLNPESFAGGDLSLDRDLACEAIGELADTLGLPLIEAARGVHKVVNAAMADQIRLMLVQRGFDPRDYTLVAFGGAGPIHASIVAEELGIGTVVVPARPGILSAFGLLTAPVQYGHMKTVVQPVDELDLSILETIIDELGAQGRAELIRDRLDEEGIVARFSGDFRYVGQGYTLEIPFQLPCDETEISEAVARFHDAHDRTYGHSDPDARIELVNVRSVHSHFDASVSDHLNLASKREQKEGEGWPDSSSALCDRRHAYFPNESDAISVPVYVRELLPVGSQIDGPAIIEQPDSTTVIYPRQSCTVHTHGSLVIKPDTRGASSFASAVSDRVSWD